MGLSRPSIRLVLVLTALSLSLVPASAAARSTPQATATDVTLTVTKAGAGSGTVISSPAGIDCGSTCSYNFPLGTTITLTARPSVSSRFVNWFSTGSGPGSPAPCLSGATTCTFTLNQAESIRATFDVLQESVSVSNAPDPDSSGTITVSGPGQQLTVAAGQQRQAFFVYGAAVTVTASAAAGSAFTGWVGDCTGFAPCRIVANKSITIQGSFAVGEKVKVQFTGKGSGTVTSVPAGISCPGTCAGLFGLNSEATLIATPAPGSYFAGWPMGSGCGDSESTCTFQVATFDNLNVADFKLDHCLVPNVSRLPLDRARSRLDEYSCRAGKIERVYSARVKKGAVISQKPRAGTRLARGAKVRLVLSRGKHTRA